MEAESSEEVAVVAGPTCKDSEVITSWSGLAASFQATISGAAFRSSLILSLWPNVTSQILTF
jgi:hypothetical protein